MMPVQPLSSDDFETLARDCLSEAAWAYIEGGAGDERSAMANIQAYDAISLRPRVLRSLAHAHTRLTLLGTPLDYPILLAPTAYHRLVHPEGELATALGAAALQACMVVSTQASFRLEDIANATASPLWFQLYMQPRREDTLQLVERAEAAGYRALVLTIDAPVQGLRLRERRAGFRLPSEVKAVNLTNLQGPPRHTARAGQRPLFGSPLLACAPTWQDVAWLATQTSLPLVLKGVTHPDDARLAEQNGAAGIIVSNHGGRILDGIPATMDLLPEIAEAVSGDYPVLLDGGIRRGADVFKALALGAHAVLVGRPCLYALASSGAAGVAHLLHILRTELEMTMAVTGCPTLADIGPAAVHASARQARQALVTPP